MNGMPKDFLSERPQGVGGVQSTFLVLLRAERVNLTPPPTPVGIAFRAIAIYVRILNLEFERAL